MVDYKGLNIVFKQFKLTKSYCLAARGTDWNVNLEEPNAYIETNIQGFMNILEYMKHHTKLGLNYASSSSVYSENKKYLFLFQMG